MRIATGRIAGHGIIEDDYSEESSPGRLLRTHLKAWAFDNETKIPEPEPVIEYILTEEELEEYKKTKKNK